jgi:hypothetical protein
MTGYVYVGTWAPLCALFAQGHAAGTMTEGRGQFFPLPPQPSAARTGADPVPPRRTR